jgi:hypothetical protein
MSEAYCKKIATKRSLPESRKSEKNSDNPENQTYFKKKKKHKKTFSEKKSSCNLGITSIFKIHKKTVRKIQNVK